MLGCRALEEGRELEIGHLFAGFRENFGRWRRRRDLPRRPVVIALVVGLATGASMFAMMSGARRRRRHRRRAQTVVLALLIMLALLLPVMMAIWFAPPLVVFHDQGAIEAMKESFVGCLRNVVPFLVYGVVDAGARHRSPRSRSGWAGWCSGR